MMYDVVWCTIVRSEESMMTRFVWFNCKLSLLLLLFGGMVLLSEGLVSSAYSALSSSSGNGELKSRRGAARSILSLIHGEITLPLSSSEQRDAYAEIILACHRGN